MSNVTSSNLPLASLSRFLSKSWKNRGVSVYVLLLAIKTIFYFLNEKYPVLLNGESKCVHIPRAGIHTVQLRVALDDLCDFIYGG